MLQNLVIVEQLGNSRDMEMLERGNGFVENVEGVITAFVHNGEPVAFVGYIDFAPMEVRGQHYHRERWEKLVILWGSVRGRFCRPKTPADVWESTFMARDVISIAPSCAHSFVSEDGAAALELSPSVYRDGDTIPLEF